MRNKISRRTFLTLGVAGALSMAGLAKMSGLFWQRRTPSIPCNIRGAASGLGHKTWQSAFPPPEKMTEIDVAIIGGGVSGLSAAWHLKKAGFQSFQLLELASQMGGNAACGESQAGAHPWGAHYLPIPSAESSFMYEFLEESGVITGYDDMNHAPIFNELYLCHDLRERLWIHGIFQEGLVPQRGVPVADREEMDRFFYEMQVFKEAKGEDGLPAFSIPCSLSSRDPRFLKWDQMTMGDYMTQHGYQSPYLRWYVNYCCRDDYGCGIDHVSAWAGIHYFAARRGVAANAPEDGVLTWPEGNGFLVKKMAETINSQSRLNALVYKVRPNPDSHSQGLFVDVYDTQTQTTETLSCRSVVFAMPSMLLPHICALDFQVFPLQKTHFPWLVANLVVDQVPSLAGKGLAWDNVSFYSSSLGYIHANHQELKQNFLLHNLTYYHPLDYAPDGQSLDPKKSRKMALQRSEDQWRNLILSDLETLHPGLQEHIQSIDIWIWGHGMVAPCVGDLFGAHRLKPPVSAYSVYFAHTDWVGFSLFEEAFYQGQQAAETILEKKLNI